MGTENIKKALALVIKVGTDLAKGLEDKKLSLAEYIGLGIDLLDAPGVIKSWSNIKAEFTDLDATERADIIEWVKEELSLPQEGIEAKIEASLDVLEKIGVLVDTF
jgi:hypothetical protein